MDPESPSIRQLMALSPPQLDLLIAWLEIDHKSLRAAPPRDRAHDILAAVRARRDGMKQLETELARLQAASPRSDTSVEKPRKIVHGDYYEITFSGDPSNVAIGTGATTLIRGGLPLAGTAKFPLAVPSSFETNPRRSGMLAGFRMGGIMFLSGIAWSTVHFITSQTAHPLPNMTLPGLLTIAVALLGIVLLSTSSLRLRLVAHFARQRQEAALGELATLIVSRLEAPSLLSVRSLRGLALGIEQKHRCPVITDKLIVEAIRSAALQLEHTMTGPELEHRLRLLNTHLLSIEDDVPPLCSVAIIDRLGAYIGSQPILAGVLCVALLIVTFKPLVVGVEWSWLTLTIVVIIMAASTLLLIATERAVRYWQPQQGLRPNPPVKPRLPIDLFLTACTSHARWAYALLNLCWGPAWEGVMFSWRSERQLAAMHDFRFDVARQLWRELKLLDIKLERSLRSNAHECAVLQRKFRGLARRLWVVTGESRFRMIEVRGAIIREDRETGITGLL